MGRPGSATQSKRNRDRTKVERQQEKQEKRLMRKEQKGDRDRTDGIDPDLVGIFPGPQPIQLEDST